MTWLGLLFIVKLMNQKGFSGLILTFGIFLFLISFALGFYLGKEALLTNKILLVAGDYLNYDFIADSTGDFADSMYPDTQLSSSLKTTKDLPSIAATSMEETLKRGNKGPSLTFVFNDGEYAITDAQDTTTGITEKAYLVKRNKKWMVYFYGNTLPSCQEAETISSKYNLKKEALTCSP